MNQGKLVSDELIIKLLSKRLESGEAKGESGFILDGFPRTINQAVFFTLFLIVVFVKYIIFLNLSNCGNGKSLIHQQKGSVLLVLPN